MNRFDLWSTLAHLSVAGAWLAVQPVALWAQDSSGLPQSALASQSLRPYWHVFIAYAIVIVLVLGWVVSISRRLRDVEDRLAE